MTAPWRSSSLPQPPPRHPPCDTQDTIRPARGCTKRPSTRPKPTTLFTLARSWTQNRSSRHSVHLPKVTTARRVPEQRSRTSSSVRGGAEAESCPPPGLAAGAPLAPPRQELPAEHKDSLSSGAAAARPDCGEKCGVNIYPNRTHSNTCCTGNRASSRGLTSLQAGLTSLQGNDRQSTTRLLVALQSLEGNRRRESMRLRL